MTDLIRLHSIDNVLIAAANFTKDADPLATGRPLGVAIGAGHKIAADYIEKGAEVIKFGVSIGFASQSIEAGSHVHTHNCVFAPHSNKIPIGSALNEALAAIPQMEPRSFQGFKRADGSVGTRNMIALVATVNCSATVIRRAASIVEASGILDEYPNVDGIMACTHMSGCGMSSTGPGWDNLQRVLWGYATHPNVGAAVFVGLGCEVMQIARLRQIYGGSETEERFFGLTIQDTGGTAKTIDRLVDYIKEILPQVNQHERSSCDASKLKVALQCGGSDGYSGITANPALGRASDMLVGLGGAVVLSETPEIYGAEQLLLERATSDAVGERLLEKLAWWRGYAAQNNASLDNNPSPGNKVGGLTTILEKSLGAVAKSGATPLMGVLDYAEKIGSSGLIFMDTPGFDPVSATGQIAGGAQLVVFTTGRGSAFGSKPAPTIKLSTNDRLWQQMPDDMDLNCGDIVSHGVSIDDKAEELLNMIFAVASGEPTKSENLGLGDFEFIPWQVGAVM